MRTVGPRPATIAFAAVVFSPIRRRRMSRTCTFARRAVSHSVSARSPDAIGSLRRKIGSSSTGQRAARTALNATIATQAGSGHQSPAARWMPIRAAAAAPPSTSPIAAPLSRSASQPPVVCRERPWARESR